MNPKISIVIPVKNGEKNLLQCLTAIIKQMDSNCELVVINNDSIDGTQAIIDSFIGPSIRSFFIKPGSRGLARTYGLQMAKGRIVAMVDADCIVQSGWLKEITTPLLELNQTVVVGKTIGPKSSSWAGIAQDADNQFLHAESTDRNLTNFTATHFALLKDSKLFLKFDRGLFNHDFIAAEDFDFWLQCLNNSIPIYYAAQAVAFHNYSNSLSAQLQKSYSRGYWTYRAHKQHSYTSNPMKQYVRSKKGLDKRKLFYSLGWALGRLGLVLILPSKKTIFETLYELSWQAGVWHSRIGFILRPSRVRLQSSFHE